MSCLLLYPVEGIGEESGGNNNNGLDDEMSSVEDGIQSSSPSQALESNGEYETAYLQRMSAYIASTQGVRCISSKVASFQLPSTISRRKKKTILLICSLLILIALVTVALLVIRPAIVGSQPQPHAYVS